VRTVPSRLKSGAVMVQISTKGADKSAASRWTPGPRCTEQRPGSIRTPADAVNQCTAARFTGKSIAGWGGCCHPGAFCAVVPASARPTTCVSRARPKCRSCRGLTRGGEGQEGRCAHCHALDLPFTRCVVPWAYEFPVTQLVQALKYEGALANARVFGTRMVAQARREQRDPSQRAALVVPMPLHPSRLVERGFNQSHEIARIVSRLLDLRLAGKGLRRIRSTVPQVGLSRQERAGNLSGAFVADSSVLTGQHVVLIDDVVTTGSTAIEAASTLRAAGAESITVWAVARALG
jgi:ComF family protein